MVHIDNAVKELEKVELDLQVVFQGAPRNSGDIQLVGSTYINGQGNDFDFAVYARTYDCVYVAEELRALGWEVSSSEEYAAASDADCWFSAKKGDLNILMCFDQDYYEALVKAADVCKMLTHFMDVTKPVRVAVHAMLMDGLESEVAVQYVEDLYGKTTV